MGRRRVHSMPFGAEVGPDGMVRFRVWAPSQDQVRLALDGQAQEMLMGRLEAGWHELVTGSACVGARYQFVLPNGSRVPDPASRFQPDDVHGPSEVIDPQAYAWEDADWKGRPWHEIVLYELHIGTFTPQGTFKAAIEKFDHLARLGITAIEIMPVGDFPGRRNWGYDGVLPFAPDSSYGRPEDFKALIEEAHARQLSVLLDVVYNHFGPEGAYQHAIAPETFTERHKTPWGAAINMDGEKSQAVRDFFIHNALYWLEEFHLDGLRLDAVHAIADDSPKHFLEEFAERVHAACPDRLVHLILENEENEAKRLIRTAAGNPRWYTAQWNDDCHHVLHVAATAESSGYYGDYKEDTERLGRALAEGFAFQGEVMPYRGRERGQPSRSLPPEAFVAFIQNHDQIGNRAFGERLIAIAPEDAVRAVAAVYLLLPQVPMLFMGEEWGTEQPFPFFCDFGAELADAVREGRRAEFARFPEFKESAKRERIPDPLSKSTFASAKLAWGEVQRMPHDEWLSWYRRIIAVRHNDLVPRLSKIKVGGRYRVVGEASVIVRWAIVNSNEELVLATNLSPATIMGFPPVSGRILWEEGPCWNDQTFGPFAVRWSLEPGPTAVSSHER
jgi:malto-oligosyltrehalose trehalohydrolase